MISEEELVDMCKQGDPVGYTELYNKHSVSVYNTITRLIEHTAEAEDILQESFVSAFQGIDKFKNNGLFRAWVKRIAINKSIDLIRKQKISFVQLEPWHRSSEEHIQDDEHFEYNIDAVNQAINALPHGNKTIFNLYVLENIPQAEIAEMLGLEHSTVRTQYHRAKQKVLKTLKQGGYHAK